MKEEKEMRQEEKEDEMKREVCGGGKLEREQKTQHCICCDLTFCILNGGLLNDGTTAE